MAIDAKPDKHKPSGLTVRIHINGYGPSGYQAVHSADVELDQLPASALAALMRQTPFSLTVEHRTGPRKVDARAPSSTFEHLLRRLRDRIDNALGDVDDDLDGGATK